MTATMRRRLRQGELMRPNMPTFGYVRDAGSLVHRLAGVRVFDTMEGPRSGIEHRWQCGGSTVNEVVLAHAAPKGPITFCPSCPEHAHPDGPGVYLARVEGRLKVGHSVRIGARMKELQGELLVVVEGDRRLERTVLELCPDPIEGREWFAPDIEGDIRQALAAAAKAAGVTAEELAS